jgi:serine/threonine protein kinase
MMDAFRNEYNLLTKCRASSYVLDSYGWGSVVLTNGQERPALLLEYSPLGSLQDELALRGPGTGLPSSVVKTYIRHAACGMEEYQALAKALHRDLKASNLLLFDHPWAGRYIKIADFGLGKVLAVHGYRQRCSPDWHAPELQPGTGHDLRLDVSRLGSLMLELLTGWPAFNYINTDPSLNEEQKRSRRCAAELDNPACPYASRLNSKELAFARSCLANEVTDWPGVEALLFKHVYLT